MESLDRRMPEDLHLTSVSALNEADVPEVRSILMDAAEERSEASWSHAPENALVCFNLDLFRP